MPNVTLRRLRYASLFLFWEGFAPPLLMLKARNAGAVRAATADGIAITDLHLGVARAGGSSDKFVTFTRDALTLIERADPRRYARLRREVRIILNEVVVPRGGGQYQRIGRLSSVDLGTLEKVTPGGEHYEWHVAQYASLLIHEATHGTVFSRRVTYNPATWPRIERLCHGEQQRFARRLRSARYDFARDLVPPFDEARWRTPEFMNPLLRAVRLVLESVKAAKGRRRGQD